MGTDLIAANIKGGMSQAFRAELDPNTESLADGIGSSYGVLHYKGKVWSLTIRGQKHNFVRPDDGTPAAYLDCVILDQAQFKSKSFYAKYDPASSEGTRPICSSIDGVTPDADVQQRQADTCALCPQNQWKQMPNGKKGRECQDYKRLAVLLLPGITKSMLGEPLMEPVFLRVPPASLNNLAVLGEGLASQGFHYSSVITRVTFDPNEPHPKMVFRAIQGLGDAEAPMILGLRKDSLCKRIVGGESRPALPQGQQQILPPSSAVPQATSTGASPSQPFGAAQVVTSLPQETSQNHFNTISSKPAEPDNISLSGFATAAEGQPRPQTTTIQSGPGAIDESDEALDAAISALLPK